MRGSITKPYNPVFRRTLGLFLEEASKRDASLVQEKAKKLLPNLMQYGIACKYLYDLCIAQLMQLYHSLRLLTGRTVHDKSHRTHTHSACLSTATCRFSQFDIFLMSMYMPCQCPVSDLHIL